MIQSNLQFALNLLSKKQLAKGTLMILLDTRLSCADVQSIWLLLETFSRERALS